MRRLQGSFAVSVQELAGSAPIKASANTAADGPRLKRPIMSSMDPRSTPFLSLCLCAALVSATGAEPAQARSPQRLGDVMAGHVAALARKPANVPLLIASGRTALQLGDAAAASGFFGRACELAPTNASAHQGMASTLVVLDRPDAAFAEFARAEQLGSPPAAIAADLGLAFDLAGNQSKAQAAYRSALNGPQAAEARRRLAVNLAIGGDPAAAAAVLEPLLAKRDRPALLTRAFILALSGDVDGSSAALDEIVGGSGSAAEPFLRALPALSAAEKAAALNLGIFPTRIAVAGGSTEIASVDAVARAARPMEYGGPLRVPSPSTPDQLKRAKLSLYGVFAEP